MDNEKSEGMGCWGKGCLFLLASLIVMGGILGWIGFSIFKKAQAYTSSTPARIPIQTISSEDFQKLCQRIDQFRQAIQNNTEAQLELSASDINAFIAMEPKWADAKGRLHVRIESDQIYVQTSLPLEKVPGFSGRFLNATFGVTLSIENGKVNLAPQSIEVEGKKILASFMKQFGNSFRESFAQKLNEDPKTAQILAKVRSLQVRGDQLLIQSASSFPMGRSRGGPAGTIQDYSSHAREVIEKAKAIQAQMRQAQAAIDAESNLNLPMKSAPEETSAETRSPEEPAPPQPLPPKPAPSSGYIGRTLEEVKRQLGPPFMTSEEGTKTILHYQNVEIISTDGVNVTDEKPLKN